jgi:hypothetical protein
MKRDVPMRILLISVLSAAWMAAPAFAGALTLQLDDPKTNPEATAQNAIVVAHITACHSPEKTTVTATAEGLADGRRQSIPLQIVRLSQPGAFAVSRQWPREGAWTVKMIATNPDYRDYATAIVIPIGKDGAARAAAKVFYHAPSAAEVDSVLKLNTLD